MFLKNSKKRDFAFIIFVSIGLALLIDDMIRENFKENLGGKLIVIVAFSYILFWRIKSFWNKSKPE